MRRRLIGGVLVAVLLSGGSVLFAEDSIRCAVCHAFGPDHPMWDVLLCATCPNPNPPGA